MKETVYLAGKITGDPFYRSKFHEAACELAEAGFIVANPAKLPEEGFTWDAYMRMSSAMLDECEAACFLPDWKESRGATEEFERATAAGKRVFLYAEWRAERNKQRRGAEAIHLKLKEGLTLGEYAKLYLLMTEQIEKMQKTVEKLEAKEHADK